MTQDPLPRDALVVPPLAQYWDRAFPADTGDASSDVLFRSVGAALTQWQMVESSFASLFGMLVHSEFVLAGRVYGSLVSPGTRRDALEAAWEVRCANGRIEEGDRATWSLLLKHHTSANQRRNEIAHAMVVGLGVDNANHGFFLVPPSYNTGKTDMAFVSLMTKTGLDSFGHHYRYTSADVNRFAQNFVELSRWASRFSGRYLTKYGTDP